MKYSHMNPEEAVKIHAIMGAGKSMGFHFETFQLTDEAIGAPREALAAALKAKNIKGEDFLAPYPGDFIIA
jgi:L-ascorbate metabolism protein UlaG (beta-lactamase superfamily)